MEDPLATSINDAFNMLKPELPSFSYPDAYVDFFNHSYLSGAEPCLLDDASHSSNSALDFPKPHDDLSQLFSNSPFPSPTPGSRYAALKSQAPHSGYSPTPWDRGLVFTAQDNWIPPINTAAPAPLSIITSGFESVDFSTVMHHGQATPGDSLEEGLSSPQKNAKPATPRRQSRKEKAIATAAATAAASSWSAMSENSTRSQGGSETKVKKQRKLRRSSKKRTAAEQAAAKRETLLKRNRQAAYKCRLKKKTQTEEVIEGVKVLRDDNAAKVVEVKRLRREVEGLRGLLLPHYRGCGGKRVVACLNGLCEVGVGCGQVGMGIGMGIGTGSVEGQEGREGEKGEGSEGEGEGEFEKSVYMGDGEEREQQRRDSKEMEDVFDV